MTQQLLYLGTLAAAFAAGYAVNEICWRHTRSIVLGSMMAAIQKARKVKLRYKKALGEHAKGIGLE